MISPRCTHDIPHMHHDILQCTHDISPIYSLYPPDVLNTPDVLNIPRCTEHTLYRVIPGHKGFYLRNLIITQLCIAANSFLAFSKALYSGCFPAPWLKTYEMDMLTCMCIFPINVSFVLFNFDV